MDEAARQVIVDTARNRARDYYLAALLAPRAARGDLIVLAAFEGEIDHIHDSIGDPMVAEIRLQWWRDCIVALPSRAQNGHPVADALADVMRRHRLAASDFIASIDARSRLDEAEDARLPLAQPKRLVNLDAAAMRRAALVLGSGAHAAIAAQVEAAGLARAYAQKSLEARRTLGEVEEAGGGSILDLTSELQLARHYLKEARATAASWSKAVRLATLPVALVEPYLQACEGVGDGAVRAAPSLADAMSPLRRVWRLWWCARTGQF